VSAEDVIRFGERASIDIPHKVSDGIFSSDEGTSPNGLNLHPNYTPFVGSRPQTQD